MNLPVGEATLSLQDVSVLLGLRINDRAFVSLIMTDVRPNWRELLALTPNDHALTGTRFWLRFLHENFILGPTDDAGEDVVLQYAQAYIVALLDKVIFADKSGNEV